MIGSSEAVSQSTTVIPAKAGTHAMRMFHERRKLFAFRDAWNCRMGPGFRRDDVRILKCITATIFIFLVCAVPAQAKSKFLDIQVVTSKGGITAWLVEDHTLPVLSFQFTIRDTGSAYDPEGRQGLAQLASNTLDEGAGKYDSQAFQKALEDNSISLHFANGRDDFAGMMKTLSRHRDLAFDLLRLSLTEPRFDAEPLDRMKAANIARIRSSMTDPDWMAARIMNSIAFDGHPYRFNAGGTLSSIQAIKADDLKAFTKRFARDRLVVSAAGDITSDELAKKLDEVFGALPASSPVTAIPDGAIKNGGTVTLYKKDIPQTIMSVMQPGIDHLDPDYNAVEIMNFILGGSGFGSRLMDEIREKRGLTYGIYTGLYDMDHIDAVTAEGSFQNKNAAQVLDLMKKEWQRMRDVPVSAKELADAKAYMIGSMPLSLSSTTNIASILASLQANHRPIDYLDKRAATLNAVTAADVQRVAKRILTPDQLTIVLVGQPDNVKPTRTIDTLPDVQ